MRPIKLEMQAFGPYENKTIVDFTEFNQNDVFLITGTTGSGKTSIFDAISFALYGQPSGNIRGVDMLRNISADSQTETYVTFTFEYHELPYTITRKPRYIRAKKSGEGLTESIADAELILPSGERLGGVKVVSDKILEILKMDQNQFAQIVMIAQNDFLKFLSSNTSDRKNILRTIFNTGFYATFEQELKSLSQIENESLTRLKDQYINRLESIKIEEVSDKSPYEHEETKQTLTNILKEESSNVKNFNEKIEHLEKTRDILNKDLTLASSTNKTLETYLKYQKEYQELINLKDAIDTKRKRVEQLTIIKQELINLDDTQANRFKELNEEKNNYTHKLNVLKDTEKQLEQHMIQYKNIKELEESVTTLRKDQIILEDLRVKVKEFETLESELNNLFVAISLEENKIISSLYVKNENVKKLQVQYDEDLNKYNNTQNQYEEKRLRYLELEQHFLTSQAGLLASQLKEDMPCPVCGSTHHPKLAVLSNVDIEQEYYAEKKNVELLQVLLSESLKDLETKRESLQSQKEIIHKYFNQHFKGDDLSILETEEKIFKEEDLESASLRLEKLQNENRVKKEIYSKNKENLEYKSEKELDVKLTEVLKDIKQLEETLKFASEKETKYKNEIIKLTTEIETSKQTLNKVELKYHKEKEEFEAKLNTLFESKDEYLKLKEDLPLLESYNNELKDYDSNLNQITSLYQEYKLLSKDLESVDTKALEEQLENLSEELKRFEDERSTKNHHIKNITVLLDDLENLILKINKQEANFKEIQTLSQTASGTLSGKTKIQFETYAQMAYFERILAFANQRLKVMSNHQYELVRRDKASNMQSQGGLDIDIFDHYHGTRREVGSLSGGELFNASLALALGLSDVIQHVSGGIKIDALFIDEGFGSLSDEYLENAIQTLVDVAGGDRMIGVISHVKELKDAIPNQILITKDKDGSHIKIIKE